MNDVEAAEKVLAQLADQKDRANARAGEIAARRQVLAYAVLARNDKKAQEELATLNQQLADLAVTIGNIDSADAEARKRLGAAKAAVARDTFTAASARIEKSLIALGDECAPELDKCWGSLVAGSAGGFRREVGLKNPPLLEKAGTLVGEIVGELKALGLDRRAPWLPGRFEQMHIDDFRLALEKLAQAYRDGPPVRAHNFVELISSWSASVKAAILAQHDEQTTNREAA